MSRGPGRPPLAAADGRHAADRVTDAVAPRPVLDLRLVGAAVGAWLTACVVVRTDPTAAHGAAVASAAGAVALLLADRRRGPGTRGRAAGSSRTGSIQASVALVLAVVSAVLVAGAAHVAVREAVAPTAVAHPSATRSAVVDPSVARSAVVDPSAGRPTPTAGSDPATAATSPTTTAPSDRHEAARVAPGPARAVVTGTVQGIARPLPPPWPGAPARARVELRVERVERDGAVTAAAGTVAVLGPTGWGAAQPGERVRVVGRWTALAAGERAAAVLVTDDDPVVVASATGVHRAAAAVRTTVARQADALGGDAGALLPGVTVGDTRAVPEDLRDALRVSGLTHLTAVSGAHFSLVGALAISCVGAVGAPRVLRAAAVALVGAGLVVLVGPSPSVLRAAVMACVGCAGLLLGRRSASPAALSTAVVVLLVVDPWLATELGFALSVLATGGLVLLGGPLAERWAAHLPRPVAAALAAPVAAQVACGPVVLAVAPAVSVLAVVANLLAAPAVAPATVLGLAGALVGTWWPAGGDLLAAPAGAACWWIGAVARGVAATPGAAVTWVPGVPGMVLLAVAGAAAVRLCWPREPAR